MSEDPSPWPESRRSQRLLFAAGGLLLLVVAAGLADVVELGGAVVVGLSAVASALLVYGLLGWAGQWVESEGAGEAGDGEDEVEGDGNGTDRTDDDADDPA